MSEGQTETPAAPSASGTSGRTYLVFRYSTVGDLAKHLAEGVIEATQEVMIPVGSQDADEADDAIKAIAKRDDKGGEEHAAVPERNFRRRKPKKKVTETWGFDD